MEANDLPETEFKTLVRRLLSELRGRRDGLREDFSRERESKHKKKP